MLDCVDMVVAGEGGESTIAAMEDYQRMEIGRKTYNFVKRCMRNPDTVAAYLNMAAICNISPRDALLLLQPGQVFELFSLWCERHGIKKEE